MASNYTFMICEHVLIHEYNCGIFEITNSLSLLLHIDQLVNNKYVKHKRINSFPFILLLVSTIDSKMNHFVYSMFIFFLIFKFNNYFYNIIIYGMHEFKSQKLIKTRFQMNKIRLGKIVLQDNQYPFRIEHTFHSNHTPCLSHYASNASHSCTQHNS